MQFYLNSGIWFFPAVMVQEDYHSQNPYHNAVHAADVTQAMHCYLKEPKVRSILTSTSLIHTEICICVYVHMNGLCAHITESFRLEKASEIESSL